MKDFNEYINESKQGIQDAQIVQDEQDAVNVDMIVDGDGNIIKGKPIKNTGTRTTKEIGTGTKEIGTGTKGIGTGTKGIGTGTKGTGTKGIGTGTGTGQIKQLGTGQIKTPSIFGDFVKLANNIKE